MSRKFKIITLCGSTKFKEEFLFHQKRLTLEGNVVITVGAFGHSGDNEVWDSNMKKTLDEIHFAKIDLSHEIFVINVGGYIGESTRNEIQYAELNGKIVKYLEQPDFEMHPDESLPRGATWLEERKNWETEVNQLREYIKLFETSNSVGLILTERYEQIHVHGFDLNHDLRNDYRGRLQQAVVLLLDNKQTEDYPVNFDLKIWKHILTKSRKEQLAIAGAWILAELDLIEFGDKIAKKQMEDGQK